MSDQNSGAQAAGRRSRPALSRGTAVAGGRYRLLTPHGGSAGLRYWQARDVRLGREVALVFVDPLPDEDSASAAKVLDRTLALSRLWTDGMAGVLDVVRGRVGGIIVAEWTPGEPLATATADRKLAHDPAAVLRPLATAVTQVHETGSAMGLCSPDQVRITPNGHAVLAFPSVTTSASKRTDVEGLGAVLYAVQTGTWPLALPDGASKVEVEAPRLPEAEREDEKPVDPQRRGATPAMAALAMRALDGSSVSSAATMVSLLDDGAAQSSSGSSGKSTGAAPSPSQRASGSAAGSTAAAATYRDWNSEDIKDNKNIEDIQDAEYAGDAADSEGSAGDGSDEDRGYGQSEDQEDPAERQKRQQRQWTIMAASGAVALVLIVLLLVQLMGGFGGRKEEIPLSAQLDALERQAQESRRAAASKANDPAAASDNANDLPVSKLRIIEAQPWQPTDSNGEAENAAQAKNAIDGNTATSWSTETYRTQFGDGPTAYKSGMGLLLKLEKPATPTTVVLTSPDTGVRFEVRAVTGNTVPTMLEQTQSLGSGTTSGSGPTSVTIDPERAPRGEEYVLVWITRLSGSDDSGYSARVQEVTMQGVL